MAGFDFNTGGASGAAERGLFVPTKILEDNLLSEATEAHECFVQQQFSADLQTFLINYVISVSGLYSVYA